MDLTLKEAFRYQAFLNKRIEAVTDSMTSRRQFVTSTVTHRLSEADPTLQDRTETEEKDIAYTFEQLNTLAERLTQEREAVSHAITKAKRSLDRDLDTDLDTNKFLRMRINAMTEMLAGNKAGTQTITGSDYRFNNEGEQKAFYYKKDITYTEDFDRSEIKKAIRDLTDKADTVSTWIDRTIVSTIVDFKPHYNVNDTFEDLLETIE